MHILNLATELSEPEYGRIEFFLFMCYRSMIFQYFSKYHMGFPRNVLFHKISGKFST